LEQENGKLTGLVAGLRQPGMLPRHVGYLHRPLPGIGDGRIGLPRADFSSSILGASVPN
jgi:hypothetical protein